MHPPSEKLHLGPFTPHNHPDSGRPKPVDLVTSKKILQFEHFFRTIATKSQRASTRSRAPPTHAHEHTNVEERRDVANLN